ncbi:MAG TPA: hypothetical protein VFI47_26085 [Acidimicrobiales bacterium]|nr:hypothetical protein [Acidimicrobiales bacterium]
MAAHLHALDDGWHEWRDDAGPEGAPSVRVRIGEGDDGRLHLVEMRIGGPLSAELLRSIPLGRIEAAANAQLHPTAAPGGDAPAPAPASLPADLRNNGVRGYPDAFYGAVALAYRHLAAATARPVAQLAAANGVPVTTAQRWVKEARRRGLLAPGRPGKAG